jgi:hypothetical protein
MMRTFIIPAVLCAIVTAATAAGPGYLAAGHPSPLLFADHEEAHKGGLPPLPKDEPVADFPIPTNAMNRCVTEIVASSAPEYAAPDDVPMETAPPPVTPQVLVNYFRTGTFGTNHNVSAIVPFGFAPPISGGPPPSSTATYISR